MPIWRKVSEMHIETLAVYFAELRTEDDFLSSLKGSGYFDSTGSFIFHNHIYTGLDIANNKYDTGNLFILDESEPSFSIENMRDAFGAGAINPLDGYESFEDFMKESFNIDIKE